MTIREKCARRYGAARGGAALQALVFLGTGVTATLLDIPPAMAQNVTAAPLSGTVVDASGNPVRGATVTVTSIDQGFSRSTVTSTGGMFTVAQLPIGAYSVLVEAAGFAGTRADKIQVQLGGVSYSFQLANATAIEEVVVQATPVRTIDFSGTATGVVFDVEEIAQRVPVTRSIQALQLLAPQTTAGDPYLPGVSMAGSSVAENIFYINGMNVTNFRTFIGGTTVPFEFYDQVQVKTGGYQAEFGRNTGGAVIALTRSGSNELRVGGNVFWEPDSGRSQSPNTNVSNNALDERSTIDGNFWASGPILKDRLFFFAFYNPQDRYTKDITRTEQFDSAGVSQGFRDTSVYETFTEEPFYGGKLDLNLFDGHRIETTYFSDSQDRRIVQDGARASVLSGGDNLMAKYAGTFTDWLTISALYGRSEYDQTTVGDRDHEPFIYDIRSGAYVYVSGNPAALIETGHDLRENFRLDADLNFDLLGRHQMRFGGDYEELESQSDKMYSGDFYYAYFRAGSGAMVNGVAVPDGTEYVDVFHYRAGGTFTSENMAYYIQDSWDVTPRLNVNVGLRSDRFRNFDANGAEFIDLDDQIAPRLGVSYDLFGDKRSKLTGFYGRYYLPVAANTNISLAGNQTFYEEYSYLLSADDPKQPVFGERIGPRLSQDSTIPNPATLISQNLKPQYMDEFVIGLEHRLTDRWTLSLNGIYRDLGAALEDVNLQYTISEFCRTQNLAGCNASNAPTGLTEAGAETFVIGAPPGTFLPGLNGAAIGNAGRVLANPGEDVIVDVPLDGSSDALTRLHIPAAFVGQPEAQRKYYALEFKFDRAFEGEWGLSGSYVWSRLTGNYEGGAKSDGIGSRNTGLTTDFDQPAYMDGANGYLPNDRRHTFKIYGSYALLDNLTLGFSGLLQSPRRFGCIGTYPNTDGRGPTTGFYTGSWYCSNPAATGLPLAPGSTATDRDPGYTEGALIGRGRGFKSDWNKSIDLSLSWRLPVEPLEELTLRVDVFNVFNWKSKLDFDEFGDTGNRTLSNREYGRVTGYQSPRYMRLSTSFRF